MQVHYAARILLYLHRPMVKGPGEFMKSQASLFRAVDQICGIAASMTQSHANILSSQCVFIGKWYESYVWQT